MKQLTFQDIVNMKPCKDHHPDRYIPKDWTGTILDILELHNVANTKKAQLIEMARNGEKRPNQKTHPLGRSLSNYVTLTSDTYDQKFDKQIRKLRPDWFKIKITL